MRKVFTHLLLLFQIGIMACNEEPNNKSESFKGVNTKPKTVESKPTLPAIANNAASEVALSFMNNYKAHCDSASKSMDTGKWIEFNPLLTPSFKITYKKLVDEAFKTDPELGLDADPIFDAQDYPDEGFILLENGENGYVTLQGKDWPDFKLVVKVIQANNNWLVDGAGIINVPEEKRVKRL
ncbi:hypothetical protein [Adhaeribacter soli]|uniref:DUF3828 domain-containing protein n=1 Tax=Adhaeribacter soli TaxID=2607655 RepID=A0A5N1IRJ4_9BACT|nr:hypothetical protein [Adhaeribacter soli]KAA9332620.1 hypothetical protein F0P94_11450 [Adhaeribacter soli]